MKRLLVFTVLVAVIASSCSVLQTGQNSTPNVDTQATIDTIVRISVEETAAAQPSPTTVPPTSTETPVVAVPSPTITVTATEAVPTTAPSTSAPNLTTTPATATSGPTLPSITATATLSSGSPTLTPTLGILLYGTLPPAVPSAKVTVINKSRAQAYISLQNYPPNRDAAFLEYPVQEPVKVNAPLGYYVYVVWVGGRQIVGEFTLHKDDDLTITIYKDKVEISR